MGRHAQLPLDEHNLIASHGEWRLYRRTDRPPTPPYERVVLIARGLRKPLRRYHLHWDTEQQKLNGLSSDKRCRIGRAIAWARGVLKERPSSGSSLRDAILTLTDVTPEARP